MAEPRAAGRRHRPPDTALAQQRLAVWRPSFHPIPTGISIFVLGLALLAIGIIILVMSDQLVEWKFRYDHLAPCAWNSDGQWTRIQNESELCPTVQVDFEVSQTIEAPSFIYYEIEGLSQRGRFYARSKSVEQLSGAAVNDPSELEDCAPLLHPLTNEKDEGDAYYNTRLASGVVLDVRQLIYSPCGVIAWSMFNDTFILSKVEADDADDASTRETLDFSSPSASAFLATPFAEESIVKDARRDEIGWIGERSSVICDGGAFDATGASLAENRTSGCTKRGVAWPGDIGVKFVASPTGLSNVLTADGLPDACERSLNEPKRTRPLDLKAMLEADDSISNASSSRWNLFLCRGWYLGEKGHSLPFAVDEDLAVWMRISSNAQGARKLYRRLTTDLTPGRYRFTIVQRYDVHSFEGKKFVVLANAAWFGLANRTLGGMYVGVGAVCVASALALAFCVALRRRSAYAPYTTSSKKEPSVEASGLK